MPGVVGIIKKEASGNEQEKLSIMLNSILHEPFYTHGAFSSAEHGLYIGFSALQGSFADCMPIFNETKDVVMFLAGECFMESIMMDDLKSRGHQFNPTDASYLVHLYEEKNEDFFRILNGWYSGIILDFKNGTAKIFNDRCGIRRIYFHESNKAFIFSSEAKALLKAFPELRKIDFNSIGEYLNYDCILDNRTYFSDIFLLPPASVWSFHKGVVTKRKYLDIFSLENQASIKKELFLEELGDTFKRVLPKYFKRGPVGMSMTGGLDTRTILACLNAAPGELPCYTFGGSYRDILDVRIAPKVAKACGQSHQVLRLDDNTLLKGYGSHVERATYISDGLDVVTKVDELIFNNMARQIAPVRMTGKYGSQVLKGIIGFQERPPVINLIDCDFRQYLAQARIKCAEIKKGNSLTFLISSVIPWWWNSIIALESSQVDVRSPFLDNDLLNILYRAPKLEGDFGVKFELDIISQMKPALMAIPTTGSYGGNYPWPLSAAVKKGSNLLMILDKIYIREELPFGMTHIVGRLDSLLAPLHFDRLFMGFAEYRRYRVWFRDQLAGYIQDVLLDKKTLSRPYWNKESLIKYVNDHIHGRGTYLREIRKALQIELIHRVLLEN